MTDVWTEGEPGPPNRSRPPLLAGIAAAVVVLAAVGATGGWLLAGANKDNQRANGTEASPSTSYFSPSPAYSSAASAEPSQTAPTTPGGAEFPLPDVIGQDFVSARQQLRAQRLGVQVVFDHKGDDRSVERTTPEAGETVHAGITVKLYVPGDPPVLQVPSLLGMACAEAGQAAADRGLTPQYEPKKAGRVKRQDPEPYAEARWNDKVKLVCEGGTTPY
jgi:PASTA domain